MQVMLKRFENPDEVVHFGEGRFGTVTLGGMTIGRATCEPRWKWSTGVSDEPYVYLHFLGAGKYAK